MNPPRPDVDVVQRRLRALADTQTDLARLRGVDAAGLRADPITRAASERLLQVSVDLAIDINAHLVTAESGRAPATGRDSFTAAAGLGILTTQTADRLAPAAGLRNILVHRYVDIDVTLVARAVHEILELMPRYIDEVIRHLHRVQGADDVW